MMATLRARPGWRACGSGRPPGDRMRIGALAASAGPRRTARLAAVLATFAVCAALGPSIAAADCPPRPELLATQLLAQQEAAGHVAVADMNGDGVPDLLMGGFTNHITIRLGAVDDTGAVSFGVTRDVIAGSAPFGFATGDFNGDHIPDLAVVSLDVNELAIYLGAGRGAGWSLARAAVYDTPERPLSVAAGDVNGDGTIDLVVANNLGASISAFLGAGDGTFGSRSDYFVGGAPGEVRLADLNQDGILDVVTAVSTTAGVAVLLGNGASGVGGGLFRPFTLLRISTGARPVSLAVDDLDGDGVLDCVVARGQTQGIDVLLGGIGPGGFRFHSIGTYDPGGSVINGPNARGVTIADLDGDGRPDIATVLPFGAETAASDHVGVYFNDGSQGFASRITYAGPDQASAIAAADLDGDGSMDVVTVGLASQYSVSWGTCAAVASVIDDFEPRAGAAGDTVTISGRAFRSVTGVRFLGVAAPIVTHAVTSLTVIVPPGAASGPITVAGPGSAATSGASFLVGERPVLSRIEPPNAKAGATVTVFGRFFTDTREVRIGGGPAVPFAALADTALAAVVDTLSTTGPVTVATPFGRVVSAFAFTVVPPDTAPRIESVRDVPGDQGGRVSVTWLASDFDRIGRGLIGSYRLLRRGPRDWGLVTTVPAAFLPRYSVIATTRADSTPAGVPYETFLVRAVSVDSSRAFDAPADSGYSVDDLPPGAPAVVTAHFDLERVDLEWSTVAASDLDGYEVHRGDHPGFETSTATLVARVAQPRITVTAEVTPRFYRVLAVDVHGNRGAATEVAVQLPRPERFELVRFGPNPTAGPLSLALALPGAGTLRLEVVDPAGRRIVDERQVFDAAGIRRLQWDGSRRLPAGLYFLRAGFAGRTVVRRFVVAR